MQFYQPCQIFVFKQIWACYYLQSIFYKDILSMLEIGGSRLSPGQVRMEDEEALQTNTDGTMGTCETKHYHVKS